MEDVHGGIKPLDPSIIKSLYLLVKERENFARIVAVSELCGERMGK